MNEYFQKNLFKDISMEEYNKLLPCLGARTKAFRTGETICSYDTGTHEIGIIGTGTASVVLYEYSGARTILERLGPQDLFGSMLSYCGQEPGGVSVICGSPCQILFLKATQITSPCANACAHHHQLTRNLLNLIAERALNLSRRVEVLSQRTIREKLMCYFSQQAARLGKTAFSLPFTMVDLADYLSIDRSAMTRELKRMKEDGLVEIDRREVRLL